MFNTSPQPSPNLGEGAGARRAFTLIELLVVISIIGLLTTIAVVSLGSTRANARNARRKADLVQISKALELYYSDNGAYPSTGGSGTLYGVCGRGGSMADSGAGGWIPNLAPTYMAILPRDPNTGIINAASPVYNCKTYGSYNCYVYQSDGIDYKVTANCTPEGTLSATDQFYDPARPTYDWTIYTPDARLWTGG
jgi:prepilin-type N-terminal cleavage/methylation domain-containing protein